MFHVRFFPGNGQASWRSALDESTTVLSVERRGSLRYFAQNTLRERILTVDLKPGQRLVERDLAEELNVSRIPLREALRELAAEGLVVLVPGKGALVAPFGPEDVTHLFDVREVLESLAARLAASRATEERLKPAADTLSDAREATAAGDVARIASANAAFHAEIVTLADNPLLASIMGPLASRVEWLFRLTASRDPKVQCSEHEALYDLIASGNEAGAASAAFAHISSGRGVSIALAERWAHEVIDPDEVARTRPNRRSRRTGPTV